MSDIKDLPGITLTRREVEMVWDCLEPRVKAGRQRYENPTFRRLGEIADPSHAEPRSPRQQANAEWDAIIVRAFDNGHPVSHIAAEFGVSAQRVRQVLERNNRRALARRIAEAERPPDPAWLTPEWREGFAEELKKAGVLANV